MLYGNDIDFLKCVFDAYFGRFEYYLNIFHRRGVCGALAPAMMTISGSTFHPLLIILYVSGLYFSIPDYSIIRYSIITICEFHDLYC